jgi:uncharacterized protein (DUF2141 family)
MAACSYRPIAAALLALPLLGADGPPQGVELRIENLRNDRGMLRICIVSDPRQFPDCRDDGGALTRSVASSARSVSFRLAPGTYAVSLIHDENGNGKLDTLLGIPREGFAFSRNPPIRFGAPRYDEASFRVGDSASVQTLRLRYLL